jgi:AAHS family 4-hydroxybenzoate transporter-like MFS transporter
MLHSFNMNSSALGGDGDAPVDIAEVIDAAPFVGLPLWVTALSFVIMTVDGYDLQSVAFAAPALAAEWSVKRELLGPVLGASIAGMAVGSILMGWLGDRIGRKSSLCLCISLLSVGSFGSAHGADLNQLVLFRFITGIGLGGATPLLTALIAEWIPRIWRNFSVALVVVGVPLGGTIGAAVAQRLIPAYGWRSVFLLGAWLPLALLALALLRLPESPKYLARKAHQGERLARSLNRLRGGRRFTGHERFVVEESAGGAGNSIASLLRFPYLATTLLIWTAFACNSLTLYSYVNWLPTVLSAYGMPLESALRGSLVFNFGGIVGALAGAAMVSRYGSRLVGGTIAISGVVASVLIGVTLTSAAGAGLGLLVLVAIAGVCMNGMQIFLYVVSAHSYPTFIRASGVGCASAAARVGGVLSSVAGSEFFSLGLSSAEFFYTLGGTILLTTLSFVTLRSHIPGTRGTGFLHARSLPNR